MYMHLGKAKTDVKNEPKVLAILSARRLTPSGMYVHIIYMHNVIKFPVY